MSQDDSWGEYSRSGKYYLESMEVEDMCEGVRDEITFMWKNDGYVVIKRKHNGTCATGGRVGEVALHWYLDDDGEWNDAYQAHFYDNEDDFNEVYWNGKDRSYE